MKFSVLGFRNDIWIELQAPVPYVTLSANQTHLNTLTNEIIALLSQSCMSGSYQLDLTWLHVWSKAQTVLKQCHSEKASEVRCFYPTPSRSHQQR